MDQTLVKIIAFCVICFTLIDQSEQIVKCYECNTNMHGTCKSISSKTPTNANCTYCVKVFQTLQGVASQPAVTSRHCLHTHQTVKSECFHKEIRNSLTSDACICDKALCNAAPTARATGLANWVTMLLALLVAVLGSRF
ncbi:uncharacterized protein [Littorina saxatilis]|uniref:Protein quiver n=1 Tax=Littorina saxatilis TaxID=31220 RepID=A0AAN9BUS4_9CAEN